MPDKARVFIVDDHPIVRQGLTMLISQEPDLCVCGEADGAPVALQAVTKLRPDVVIVDISMKDGDGIDLIKSIRAHDNEIHILVLSMHEEMFIVERAMRAGASGYLPKQEASDKVLTAIRSILSGGLYVSESLSPRLMERLLADKSARGEDAIARLSDRELQVFQRLGDGMGTQEIADAMHLSVKTIETYREHIKVKLDLKDARQLMQYAIRWNLTRKNI